MFLAFCVGVRGHGLSSGNATDVLTEYSTEARRGFHTSEIPEPTWQLQWTVGPAQERD